MKRIKVLFLYPNEFLGPELTVFAQIIKNLDKDRFAVYVALNKDAEGNLNLGEAQGVKVMRFRFGRSLHNGLATGVLSGLRLPGEMLALARFARREGIQVVQCTSAPRAGLLGLLLARLAGAKLVLHYHVIAGRYGGARGFLESFIAHRADGAVAVSKFLADQVRPRLGLPEDAIAVVVNGIDAVRFNPSVDGSAMRAEYGIAPDEVLVLEMARLMQQKRQEDTIRAFALARREVPNLRGLLVGWEDPRYEGPFSGYKAELEHICKEEELGSSLIIADARPEAPQLLAAADMLVLPSIEDACPLTVIEAMAAGKPVVGTNSGGIPELVADGVTGYLVPERDTRALADKMVLLAKDAQLRAQMGRAGRQRADSVFTEAHVASEFAAIFERLAQKQGRGDKVPVHTTG